jgi:hypothetical protein
MVVIKASTMSDQQRNTDLLTPLQGGLREWFLNASMNKSNGRRPEPVLATG